MSPSMVQTFFSNKVSVILQTAMEHPVCSAQCSGNAEGRFVVKMFGKPGQGRGYRLYAAESAFLPLSHSTPALAYGHTMPGLLRSHTDIR